MAMRARHDRRGFTLIELLVVIAIIALLVSILVPSLKKAQELGRRAVCVSNLHTMAVSIQLYAAQFSDALPQPEPNYEFPGRFWCEYSADGVRNAWAVLIDYGYLALPPTRCPSSHEKAHRHIGFPEPGEQRDWRKGSYSYRHNFISFPKYGVQPPLPKYLTMEGWPQRVMLADDADYGIGWGGGYPGTFALETEAKKVNPAHWAHVDGGNVATHDGSVHWIENFWDYTYPTSPDSWPNYYRGWPCTYFFGGWPLLDGKLE